VARGRNESNRETGWSIRELAELASTTPRTIRYYLLEGLLPAPGMRGRYAAYSPDHLNRLRLIQRLKDAFLPLAAIRAHLERLTPEQIGLLAAGNVHLLPDDADDAARYLARLLEVREPVSNATERRPKKALWIGRKEPPVEAAGPDRLEADVWRRYTLREGIELHIREGNAITELNEEKIEEIRRILRG